jgi:type IX secretion system PorP/SprF family membrane protein
MRKIALIILFFAVSAGLTKAGQDPIYTQFMTNPFLINPALTGTYPYYQIITNNRIQWVGMADAPITNTISMYGPMVTQPMGVGGYIMNDVIGPESRTSINGTYAYSYVVNEQIKVSMGLMLGFISHKIDGSKLRIGDDKNKYDPYFTEGEVYKNLKPDASVGAYMYTSTYNAGFAVTNLFGNKLQFDSPTEADTTVKERSTISRMKQHIYLHGGYKYLVNTELAIEPAIIFRKVAATPLQVDFNVRAWYGKRAWNGNKFWGGVSYRSQDAVSVLLGVIYQNKIEVGYSYDIGINKLNVYNTGSHELMITFRFNNIKEY